MNNIDWDEVETKISLICRKFDNLAPWHEDLAQELRIHAYYYSDNYYDLYRKAIDFWRKIQTRHTPEIPYFDLEVLNLSTEQEYDMQYSDIVNLVNKELERPGLNKCDNEMLDVAKLLLQLILFDIDPKVTYPKDKMSGKSTLNHYRGGRLNLSWVAEETNISYKRLISAMKFLEDTIRGLSAMGKIDIPLVYFNGYYD